MLFKPESKDDAKTGEVRKPSLADLFVAVIEAQGATP